ncbi:methionine biosynthesis protein MetW [Streptomyces sp. PT12]|uniref:methionine biosynthesis protein MetW n=1 Tax=Streptomyces sp. PT12 TaxID=1510197 RepID=UPI00215BD0FA|nr:methionine biosynthesis protein MetW [Streptomyces sp. PT12]
MNEDHARWGHTASTGLGFTHPDIVEAHFAACADAYRAAFDEAGIEPGWRVLDAGCGSGAFLPWIAEQAIALGLDGDWKAFLDPEAPDHPLTAPGGSVSEGNTVAIGTVP